MPTVGYARVSSTGQDLAVQAVPPEQSAQPAEKSNMRHEIAEIRLLRADGTTVPGADECPLLGAKQTACSPLFGLGNAVHLALPADVVLAVLCSSQVTQ